jgi:predicted secreted hydrolase
MRAGLQILFDGLLFLLISTILLSGDTEAGYRRVTGPCNFEFPDAHGAHPDYRTEWWYYTGNVATERGRIIGFQLTFFRSRIRPPNDGPSPGVGSSAWRTDHIILAHAAVSDIAAGRHLHDEAMGRWAMDIAGIEQNGGGVTIYLKDWRAHIGGDRHHLSAATPEFSLSLTLISDKPPVPHGTDGYSRKGSAPHRASCYYSLTRMAARGHIRIGDTSEAVSGWSWMDHEYSTAPLEPGLQGWDWFSIQLSDATELMVYLLRKPDGSTHPASSGTFVGPGGAAKPLMLSDIRLAVLDTWKSPKTGARYPSGWRLRVPKEGIDLTIRPRLADQEMTTPETTGVTYWEGSVAVEGVSGAVPVVGAGYVELTGYAGAFVDRM